MVDDLLHKMMELDAKKRITVEEALEHDFFKEIRHTHWEYGKALSDLNSVSMSNISGLLSIQMELLSCF